MALLAAINGSGSNKKKSDARAKYKKAFCDYVIKKDVLDKARAIAPSAERFRASDELKTPTRKSPPIPLTASDKLKSPPPSSVPLAAAAAKRLPGQDGSDNDDIDANDPPATPKTNKDDDRKPAAITGSPAKKKLRKRPTKIGMTAGA